MSAWVWWLAASLAGLIGARLAERWPWVALVAAVLAAALLIGSWVVYHGIGG